jgi:muramoyltetrapeptide carboxypeptidase
MIPPFLQQGDTIAIAATARKISEEEVVHAKRVFENWGLRILLPLDLYESAHQFAGTDKQRAQVFQQLLDNTEIKAIICARGGYGTVRIIDLLDFTQFNKQPKWIVGYSDITVLHSHITTHTDICTLHATMPINMQPHNADEASINSVHDCLFGKPYSYHIPHFHLNKTGVAQGKLIGGNLSVLYSLLGSASDLDTENCILFLEDLDEYLYHIDRMMVNLKRNGKLAHLAGLIIGGMSDMKDNNIPFGKDAYQIIAEHTQAYNYPILFGMPAGHEKKNLAIIIGATHRLEVTSESAKLSLAF